MSSQTHRPFAQPKRLAACLLGAALIAGCGRGSHASSSPAAASAAPAANVTNEYFATWSAQASQSRAFADATARFQGAHVIFVPGYRANEIRKAIAATVWRYPNGRALVSDYFEEQDATLTAAGVGHEVLAVDTSALVAENAKAIRARVHASQTPVILFGHSKGGLDALEALIGMPDEDLRKVKGFLALQTPFQGAPLADVFANVKPLRVFLDILLTLRGENPRANAEITQETRRLYNARHAERIAAVLAKVPTLTVGTYKMNLDLQSADTVFELSRNWMLDKGWQNDGLVPSDSVRLGQAPYVVVPGADHVSTVLQYWNGPALDRKVFTKTLLAMLAQRMPAPAP